MRLKCECGECPLCKNREYMRQKLADPEKREEINARYRELRRLHPEKNREMRRKWWNANAEKREQYLANRRARKLADPTVAEKLREKARARYRQQADAGYRRERTEEHKQRDKAPAAVSRAVRRGQIAKPDICSVADGTCLGQIEAHHYKGYALEHRLDVVWLCRSHHMRIDAHRIHVPALELPCIS